MIVLLRDNSCPSRSAQELSEFPCGKEGLFSAFRWTHHRVGRIEESVINFSSSPNTDEKIDLRLYECRLHFSQKAACLQTHDSDEMLLGAPNLKSDYVQQCSCIRRLDISFLSSFILESKEYMLQSRRQGNNQKKMSATMYL